MSKFHLNFDGAGYTTLPADAPKFENDEFSIEFMARTPEGESGGGVVFDSYDPDGGPYGFGRGIRISLEANGRPTAIIEGGLRHDHLPVVATGSFVADTWYHYCLTLTSPANQARWYIDAEQRGIKNTWGGPYDTPEGNKYIGANRTGSGFDDYFKGDIYCFGYYTSKALNAEDIQSRYQAVDFAGTEDGLSWASNFNTGNGTVVYDMVAGVDGIISSLDHVGWQITDIPFAPPYEIVMRHVPGRGNLRSILMPPFGGLGGLIGGIRIYRGQDGNINYDNIIATMAEGDAQVVIPGQDLPPNTTWHYVRRKVQPCCGLESPDSPACIVVIGADGEMIGNVPNTPQNVTAGQLAGAKIKIKWRYTSKAQEAAPTGFKIYMDSGSGFDFESPIATVAYNLGELGEFNWTSGALTDGHTYRFCVRSYREGGGESRNTDYTSTVADSTGPDAITGLCATWQEVPG